MRTVTANKSFQNWIIQASDGNQITKEAVFILSSLCCSIITYKYGLLAEPGLLCQADKALSVLPRTSQRAHLLHGPDGTASFRATEISAAAYVMFFHKETFTSLITWTYTGNKFCMLLCPSEDSKPLWLYLLSHELVCSFDSDYNNSDW